MKLLNRLSKRFQILTFALLAVMPLLAMSPPTLAENDDSVDFSQAELDQMLAPIALYPDALLSQVLIASTYPLEIIQADRWVRSNKDLKTEDALKFAENKDWDPSVKALVAFPDVLQRLSENVDWTQRLGDAFLNDEDEVMDTVQRLRKRAYASGNLEKAQHISVEQENDSIVIEPAQERVVYVPVYDTRVVYGNWWWPDYPPVYWHYPSSYTYVSGFYWGPSIYIGPTYFYSSVHWRDRRVVVIDRHTHYAGSPHFYTGRSIVRHQSSRAWRHNPAHRHGVAYYNNNLRETYGSRRDSRLSDRQYREQHRELSRPEQRNLRVERNPNRTDNRTVVSTGNPNPERIRTVDRAERVQERFQHRQPNIENNTRQWRGDPNQANQRIQANNTSGDSNTRTRDVERVRAGIQNRHTEVKTGDSNDRSTAAQEPRRPSEQARPNFPPPAREVERRGNNPGVTIERREEPPRRAETSSPQRMERSEQRAERASTRFEGRERPNNQDRVRNYSLKTSL
jgi:hypothetical protein